MSKRFIVFLITIGTVAIALGTLLASAEVEINDKPKYGIEIDRG